MIKVEEVLAITVLKKLLKFKHLVEEDIFLGEHIFGGLGYFGNIEDYRLFLTRKGLLVKDGENQYPFTGPPDGYIVDFYNLTHNKLRKIKEQLEEVYEQKRR